MKKIYHEYDESLQITSLNLGYCTFVQPAKNGSKQKWLHHDFEFTVSGHFSTQMINPSVAWVPWPEWANHIDIHEQIKKSQSKKNSVGK